MDAPTPTPLPRESFVNIRNPSAAGQARQVQHLILPVAISGSSVFTSNSPVSNSSSPVFTSRTLLSTSSAGEPHQTRDPIHPVATSNPPSSTSRSTSSSPSFASRSPPFTSSSPSSTSSAGVPHQVDHLILSATTSSSPSFVSNSPSFTSSSSSSSSVPLTMAYKGQALTPPLTPLKAQYKRSSASVDVVPLAEMAANLLSSAENPPDEGTATTEVEPRSADETKRHWKATVPRPYPRKYRFFDADYGSGAWSIVHQAVEVPDPLRSNIPLSPPGSPMLSPATAGAHRLLAVKAPSRRDACRILEREARILTYLHSFALASGHLVPFHGYDELEKSLVFDAVPLDLENHVRIAADTARLNFSTQTMYDPVLGAAKWARLAIDLADGLAFLHSVHCVHSDIKPANILLRASSDSEILTPLFCDFSSSHIAASSFASSSPDTEHDSDDEKTEDCSAVTQGYTSPEFLTALRYNGKAIATPASDVFALATTLLVAAIGESPYAAARIELQKLVMAKEGRPLDFARSGENASRVMPGKLVDRILRGGIEKEVEKRLSVGEWREAMAETMKKMEILG